MYKDLTSLCVSQDGSLRQAMTQMDHSRLGIVLVVDAQGKLVGTITDGDVRRAFLVKADLEQPVKELLARKAGTRYMRPITARVGADRSTYLELLRHHSVLHLPIVDAEQRVVGLVTQDEFLAGQGLPLRAVVMAGGEGSRLHPLTEDVPKPMLRVGELPDQRDWPV